MDRKSQIKLFEDITPVLYILKKLNRASKHHISKTLYFADRAHISKFGRPITGDTYIAMKDGPVPSLIYDYFKAVSNQSNIPLSESIVIELKRYLQFEPPHFFIPLQPPNMDFLSKSSIACLDDSINFCKGKGFATLSDLSHDFAWEKANKTYSKKMNIEDIAIEAGANEQMLAYIHENV